MKNFFKKEEVLCKTCKRVLQQTSFKVVDKVKIQRWYYCIVCQVTTYVVVPLIPKEEKDASGLQGQSKTTR
jgi:hypothetical protein